MPQLKDARYLGIKYGRDGVNCAVSIASKTTDGRIFVESLDCVSVRAGNGWIFEFLRNPKVVSVAIDGASGQQILADQIKQYKFKSKVIMPTVGEIIQSNAMFEQDLYAKQIVHRGQNTLKNVVCNCKKRLIGSKGGFGYSSLVESQDIAVMESMILAYWLAVTTKEEKKKQKVSC